jgi:hypothetical protein
LVPVAANEGPLPKPDMLYTIERWTPDGTQRLEVLASGESFADAKIAYEVAIESQPDALIMLCQGMKVIKKSRT